MEISGWPGGTDAGSACGVALATRYTRMSFWPQPVEAATGLGQMRIDPDMNLDVAAYSQAKMLIIFARDANVDGGRAAATGTLPVMHWRVAAARTA